MSQKKCTHTARMDLQGLMPIHYTKNSILTQLTFHSNQFLKRVQSQNYYLTVYNSYQTTVIATTFFAANDNCNCQQCLPHQPSHNPGTKSKKNYSKM